MPRFTSDVGKSDLIDVSGRLLAPAHAKLIRALLEASPDHSGRGQVCMNRVRVRNLISRLEDEFKRARLDRTGDPDAETIAMQIELLRAVMAYSPAEGTDHAMTRSAASTGASCSNARSQK